MVRMGYEILENNIDEKELIIAGIRESGSVIARNIQRILNDISHFKLELITLRLDKKMPEEVILSSPVKPENKVIIVVDDVSNTGKTLLYALKPFLSHHPKRYRPWYW